MKAKFLLLLTLVSLCVQAKKYYIDAFSNGKYILVNGKPTYEGDYLYDNQKIDMRDVKSMLVIDDETDESYTVPASKLKSNSTLKTYFSRNVRTIGQNPIESIIEQIGDTLFWSPRTTIVSTFPKNNKRIFVLEVMQPDGIYVEKELHTINDAGKTLCFLKEDIWGEGHVCEISCRLKYFVIPKSFEQKREEVIIPNFIITPFRRND